MKYALLFVAFLMLSGFNPQNDNTKLLQARIDIMQQKLDNAYKPGVDEYMLSIQAHHAKLWFAGQNKNWKLAEFEANEINESLENIATYCSDRTDINSFCTVKGEIKYIGMMKPSMDSVAKAIEQKNQRLFNTSFKLLTQTCNNCHVATKREFNVITIPTANPSINQDFTVMK